MTISDRKLPPGYELIHLQQCASTNSEALKRATSRLEQGLWVLADKQTAGRGRQGRQWLSETGNLFASLAIRPSCDLETASQLALVSGVATIDCLRRVDAQNKLTAKLSLKWPNDIMVEDAKLGGILLESVVDSKTGGTTLVVGVGLNIVSAPVIEQTKTTELSAHSINSERDAIFVALTFAVDEWLKIWNIGRGFQKVRDTWMHVAYKLGGHVKVSLPSGIQEGRFLGLNDKGALILEPRSGACITISSGEVFFDEHPTI